jgi:CBS domain-containing protein
LGPLAPLEVPGSTRVATALRHLRDNGCEHLITRDHGHVRAVAEVDLLRDLLDGGPRPTRMSDTVSAVATPVPSVAPTLRRSQAAALLLSGDHALLLVVADGVRAACSTPGRSCTASRPARLAADRAREEGPATPSDGPSGRFGAPAVRAEVDA